MRQWLSSHLTYANVLSTLCLFLLLGGGTAVALNGSNTVFSDDIVNGQVTTPDLANGAVALGKLGANSVNAGKVVDGSLTAADANTNSLQRRVTGICPSGKAATAVTQVGSLTCAATNGGVASGVDALFGDGSDGNQTIATDTTLSRDTYYHDLTIDPGTTLNPGGYRIFVSGTLTFGAGAAIARDGNDAVGSFGGPGLSPSGTLGVSSPGVSSGDGAGASITNSLGGAGGDGPGGASTTGGQASPPTAAAGGAGVFRQALSALSGRSLDGARVNGGAGGASNNTTLSGGGAGGGGGVVVVAARAVALSGSAAITANGGAGATDGTDGGGGGGGGVVVVITATPKPGAMTVSAAGGAGGGDGGLPGAPGFTAWLD